MPARRQYRLPWGMVDLDALQLLCTLLVLVLLPVIGLWRSAACVHGASRSAISQAANAVGPSTAGSWWMWLQTHHAGIAAHQTGGGASDEELEQRALRVAELIRSELGEKVNKPGLAAIRAVLLMRKRQSLTQLDAMKRYPTTKDSIRKYRALIERLGAVPCAGTTRAVQALVAEPVPTAAGTTSMQRGDDLDAAAATTPPMQRAELQLAESTLLQSQQMRRLQQHLHVQSAWIKKHVPSVLSVHNGPLRLSGAHAVRTIEAHVLSPLDEETVSTVSGDIQYDLPPLDESAADATRRADRHRRREEKLIRSFDIISVAEHRAADSARHRASRKLTSEVRQVLNGLIDDICSQLERTEKAEPLLIQSTIVDWMKPVLERSPEEPYWPYHSLLAARFGPDRLETRVDDLLWIQPVAPARYQLAVLKRIKSGGRVDVQLCGPVPPGHGGRGRVIMHRWRFNLAVSDIIGPVLPLTPLALEGYYHYVWQRDRWTESHGPISTAGLQMWRAAQFAQTQDIRSRSRAVSRARGFREDNLTRGMMKAAGKQSLSELSLSERIEMFREPISRVPLLSTLASQALPECLLWTHLMSGPFPRRPPEDQPVTRAQMLREMELERRAQESIRAHKLVPMSNMPMPNSGSDEDALLLGFLRCNGVVSGQLPDV